MSRARKLEILEAQLISKPLSKISEISEMSGISGIKVIDELPNNKQFLSTRTKGIIMALTAAGIWGISGTVAQELFHHHNISSEWLVTIRMLIAGPLLIFFSIFNQGLSKVFKIWLDIKDVISLLLFSILGMLGVQYAYFASVQTGNAATATLLQFLGPLFVSLYYTLKLRRLPSIYEIFGLSLALLGTYLLISGNLNGFTDMAVSSQSFWWGIISAISLAFYTIFPRKLLSRWGSGIIVGKGMTIGGIILFFIQPPSASPLINASFSTYLYITFVVILGTLLAFYLFINSLRYITATHASILASAEPLSAVITSTIWLNTAFNAFQAAGGIFIITTVLMLTLDSGTSKKASLEIS